MARSTTQSIGAAPPTLEWTIVRGDTASFRCYVTDDNKDPITVSDWTIAMDIERNSVDVLSVSPAQEDSDGVGEFTVSLAANESEQLESGDMFDIQLSHVSDGRVWTVAKGSFIVIEDVTD